MRVASDDILRMRLERGLTRRAAAVALGITENSLYLFETNPESNPTAATIKAIADFYETTTDYILGR